MKGRIIAMAIAGLGLFLAPMAQADSCDTTKSMVGPGVTEYRYTQTVTPAQSVIIERPVLLENRIVEKQVVKERVPVYINRRVSHRPVKHHKVRRIARAHTACSNKVISSSSTIERTIEKPIVVERPVIVERNRTVERPVYIDRVVEKPVVVERRVVSNPVVIQRTVSRPVVIQRPVLMERTIQQPVIIEKRKRHLLNLHVL